MNMFSSISSSKALPFDSHIDNDAMEVYGDSSLNPKDHNFICQLADSTRYLNRPNLILEEGEIGVFGAEKYFNGGVDDMGSQKSIDARKLPSRKQLEKLVVADHQPKPRLGTPSVGSESSSVNSQRPLLKIDTNTTATTNNDDDNNNNYSSEKRNKNNKRFLLSTLKYCMCYSCNDKTVVDLKEDVGEISFSNAVRAKPVRQENNQMKEDKDQMTLLKEKPFSFPTKPLKSVHFQEEEVEQNSLEVFGSSVAIGKLKNKPTSLEKRLAMVSWDHTNNNNNSGILFYNDDEVDSDCSSDLFEIESLTKQTNSFQSPSPPCYAPSEASVEWSVVTASVLDSEERRPSTTSPTRVVKPPLSMRVNANKEVVLFHKRRLSSLLGCKNEKGLKVPEHDSNDRKISAKANSNSNSNSYNFLLMERRESESSVSVPVKKFEDHETSLKDFGFRDIEGVMSQVSLELSMYNDFTPIVNLL